MFVVISIYGNLFLWMAGKIAKFRTLQRWAKEVPKNEKNPLPVDMRCSKTPLLILPILKTTQNGRWHSFFFPEILIKRFRNSFPSCLEIQKNCNVCNFFRGIVLEKTVWWRWSQPFVIVLIRSSLHMWLFYWFIVTTLDCFHPFFNRKKTQSFSGVVRHDWGQKRYISSKDSLILLNYLNFTGNDIAYKLLSYE